MNAVSAMVRQWLLLLRPSAPRLALHLGAFALSLLLIKVIFAVLGGGEYAIFALIISISVLVRIVWYNLVAVTFARFVSVAGERGVRAAFFRYLAVAVAAPLLLAGGLSLLFLPLSLAVGAELVLPGAVIGAGLVLGCAIGASVAVAEVDNADGHWRRSAVQYLAPSVVQICGALAAGHFGQGAVAAAVIAAGLLLPISLAHLLLLQSGGVLRRRVEAGTLPMVRELAVFAVPMAVWIVPAIVGRVADRWVLAAATDANVLAAFALMAMLTQNVMAALYTVLNRVFLPSIFSHAGDGGNPEGLALAHRGIAIHTLALCGAGLGMIACYAVVGGGLITVLAGSDMAPFAPLLQIMALGATLQTVGDLQLLHGQVERRLGVYTAYRLAFPAIYIGSALLLVGSYSATGMVLAYVLASAVGCAICFTTNYLCFGSAFLPAAAKASPA